ncbi:MAG: WYL domain-containing protein [Myxococcaceae bacterium]|jgi:proteasome accessory factor B|nr:WYL domain-containing protein [Myxococcaceae bacterium]
MARGDSAARQIRLFLMVLDRRDIDVRAAADELGCTERTVYRDLESLERVGVPLYQVKQGRTQRWKLVDGYSRNLNVSFTVQEAMALIAGERLLSAIQGSVFDHAARNAVAKVKHALAPELRQRVEHLAQVLTTTSAPPRKLARHRERLDTIIEAIERSVVVDLKYRKLDATQAQPYTVEPHHLHLQGTSVYVVGWARERKAVRIFLLDRIDAVTLRTEPFKRRPEIQPGLFAQGSFGLWDAAIEHVRLRFTGSAATIVSEQEFHPSQTLERLPDGSVIVDLRAPLSPSLKQWVRGFGKRVEVLSPAALKDA